MRVLQNLFDNNRNWAQGAKMVDPQYFEDLVAQQNPKYLWIGCADSRVPANQITGLPPGEVFVHRNIANVVVHSDFNCLSVIEFAVAILKVEHIIVCGHYGCGGVKAALQNNKLGLIDNWLRHIRDVRQKHDEILSGVNDPELELRLLCEFNVIEQVYNVCHTTIVQNAWEQGQELAVHGWIYSLKDGLLNDLNTCVTKPEELSTIYRMAVSSSRERV
jgi:carbonic anhydrase